MVRICLRFVLPNNFLFVASFHAIQWPYMTRIIDFVLELRVINLFLNDNFHFYNADFFHDITN